MAQLVQARGSRSSSGRAAVSAQNRRLSTFARAPYRAPSGRTSSHAAGFLPDLAIFAEIPRRGHPLELNDLAPGRQAGPADARPSPQVRRPTHRIPLPYSLRRQRDRGQSGKEGLLSTALRSKPFLETCLISMVRRSARAANSHEGNRLPAPTECRPLPRPPPRGDVVAQGDGIRGYGNLVVLGTPVTYSHREHAHNSGAVRRRRARRLRGQAHHARGPDEGLQITLAGAAGQIPRDPIPTCRSQEQRP